MAGRQSCSPDILRCTASTAQWVRVHPKIGGSPTIKVQWSRIIAIIGHSSPLTSNICFNSLQPHPPSNHSILLSKTFALPGFLRKICRNICWKKSTGCFADAWVPFRFLQPHFLLETQSTRGNVVNFCYDRLRDNPTIAKHFVYLSHSHKSSRILKQQKKEKYSGLVGV